MSPKASTTKLNKKQWYAATLIVRVRIEDHPGPYVCHEQVRLIQARSAEKAYKKALEKDPAGASSDVYLAVQYIQSGRLDEGLKELDELIKK